MNIFQSNPAWLYIQPISIKIQLINQSVTYLLNISRGNGERNLGRKILKSLTSVENDFQQNSISFGCEFIEICISETEIRYPHAAKPIVFQLFEQRQNKPILLEEYECKFIKQMVGEEKKEIYSSYISNSEKSYLIVKGVLQRQKIEGKPIFQKFSKIYDFEDTKKSDISAITEITFASNNQQSQKIEKEKSFCKFKRTNQNSARKNQRIFLLEKSIQHPRLQLTSKISISSKKKEVYLEESPEKNSYARAERRKKIKRSLLIARRISNDNIEFETVCKLKSNVQTIFSHLTIIFGLGMIYWSMHPSSKV